MKKAKIRAKFIIPLEESNLNAANVFLEFLPEMRKS